ncbi:hypothetical protein FDUTEX481_04071 [Tolypothrix sp. PCC 7601]|nr:hypothetical protein FDUTEX481_04071 [Tolypothrix sp. PCC 7601]BAY92343.1 putative transposase [Microchaete diplosiphon NIES-3275]
MSTALPLQSVAFFFQISITLKLLLLLLQVHRQAKLSVLASVFPQPIQYGSRKRNLQRFLNLQQPL